MIEIVPAIDILDGKCVRLTRGDFSQVSTYDDDPIEAAKRFEAAGLTRLHLVDLDGAKSGIPRNLQTLEAIANKTPALTIDFGGGIKTTHDVEAAFNSGAAAVNVGSVAVKEPERFYSWLEQYGSEKIILGADSHNGNLAINGWQSLTKTPIIARLLDYRVHGGSKVCVTDISRDGTLQGPAISLYKQIVQEVPGLRLTASGGVSSLSDIRELQAIGCTAVIVGKAIYEGQLSLKGLVDYNANAR